MADERIDIEVVDKVSNAPANKIRDIAQAAREGASAVEQLQRQLAALDASNVSRVTAQATRSIAELNRVNAQNAILQQRVVSATAQASTATQRLATATVQTAVAEQRLATETERTATQMQRTAAATEQAAAANDRAALAALRLEQAQAKSAAQAQNAANRIKNTGDATERAGNQIGLGRQHLVNLGFQLQDIGVSLASGQNPLTVFIQQGAQIQGIASQAGVSMGAMARAAAGLLLPLLPLAAAAGGVAYGFNLIAKGADEGGKLEAYAKSLGLTSKQIEKMNADSITLGDTLKGLWATIDQNTGASKTWDKFADGFEKAFKNVLGIAALGWNSLMAMGDAAVDVLIEAWNRFPTSFKKPIIDAINVVIEAFEKLVNFSVTGINQIIAGLNKIATVKIDPMESVTFGRVNLQESQDSGKDLATVFVNSYTKSLKDRQAATNKFITDWQANSLKSAKDRVKEEADKAGGAGKTAENRAAALAKVNAQLDNEIDRLYTLKPEREAQARFDQIEEQLIGKKIKLTADEAQAIKDKIKTIQDAAYVQQQYDRIYEEAVGPARDYNSVVAATQKLLEQKAITEQQAAQQILKASEAQANALDPMRQYNRELDQQMQLLRMIPDQREIEQQVMQVSNDLLNKGIQLTTEETAALRQKLETIQFLNRVSAEETVLMQQSVGARQQVLDQIQAIQNLQNNSASGYGSGDAAQGSVNILQNMGLDTSNLEVQSEAYTSQLETMYAQVDAMRQADLISEQDAASLRAQIWAKGQEQTLASASQFFGYMTQLQKSENGKMAAVGKAAAIAQAMINTYQAATGAYSAMASIPYVGPALGAAAAAAAVVAGLANVQQIRSQQTGFQRGGYTGSAGVSEVVGNVHGQEYVMDAASTSAIGVSNLNALRAGAATVQRNGEGAGSATPAAAAPVVVPAPAVNVTPIMVSSHEQALAALNSAEGQALVVEAIQENGTTVAKIIGIK